MPSSGTIAPSRWIALVLLVFLASCRGGDHREAPPPELEDDLEALPELPASMLDAPLYLDLNLIMGPLEEAIPRSFGDLDQRLVHPSNDRVTVAFEVERGPVELRVDGSTVTVGAELRYRGRGWYDPPLLPEVSASCGTSDTEDNRPAARVTLASPISIAPDWTLRSNARVASIERSSDRPVDDCRVTTFGIDVTERVLDAAEGALGGATSRIDEAVAGVDLRGRIERLWQILSEPIELTDQVWLVIAPRGVSHGPIAGDGSLMVSTRIHLDANPRLVVGPRPQVAASTLPELGSGSVSDGLHILLEARGDYEELAELLNRELGGMEITSGGNRVTLRDFGLRGIGGGKIALEVSIEGPVTGQVFLVGTPRYDEATDEIRVPDLELDVGSRNFLLEGAGWLARGPLAERLRDRARFPAGGLMSEAEALLARGLNRDLSDEVTLSGEVRSARILDVVALRDALVVRAHAEARAQVEIHTRR